MRAVTYSMAILIALAATAVDRTSAAEPVQLVDATEAEIEAIRAELALTLKDAESARFKDVRREAGERGGTTCGYVNAKNSYGAYSGFQLFHTQLFILPTDPPTIKALVVRIDDGNSPVVPQFCREAGVIQ